MPGDGPGIVYLVGAGPGDPGLISVRAVECLKSADLVLYDGLANPLLLRHTDGVCERTSRARRDGVAIVPQEAINERLIAEARAGRVVVRLKGGDPYIFGRGSEEADALHQAGIRFEVVPGITAATAAAEYAGFSFTHRDVTSAVAFVTGHEDPARDTSRLDYAALAAFPGTLVFYMGLSRIEEICGSLIGCGMSNDVPAAVVCQATLPGQRVLVSTVGRLAAEARAAALRPPSLIVVGDCVLQRERLSWFEQLPLFGVSIGIPRPADQCDEIADHIVRLGGQPLIMPLLRIASLDESAAGALRQSLKELHRFDWLIFTSANGVREFMHHLQMAGRDVRAIGQAQIAAIGQSTADALRDCSLLPDLVAEQSRAEMLAEALGPHVAGRACLWLRASRGRDVLPQTLLAAGANVTEWVVYQNLDVEQLDPAIVDIFRNQPPDWIGLSSPSMARHFVTLLAAYQIDAAQISTRIASISPLTSEAVREAGLTVAAESLDASWNGILQAIIQAQRTPF